MTLENKISRLKLMLDNDSTATKELCIAYLEDAKYSILVKMYPFGFPKEDMDIPSRYDMLQVKLAARYFLRRGAEGEISHNEDGVNRTYGSVNDTDLLDEVMTVAKVVR